MVWLAMSAVWTVGGVADEDALDAYVIESAVSVLLLDVCPTVAEWDSKVSQIYWLLCEGCFGNLAR